MRTKVFMIMLILSGVVFTGCKDNKAEQEEKERMERMEAEREAELRAEEERMEWESNSIAARARENQNLSTLSSALQSAELDQTLTEEEGPYTVFAPSNEAFSKIEKAKLDTLMSENRKDDLANVLKYHVVEDEITSDELIQMIEDNNGEYKFQTMEGAELTAMLSGENVVIKDENGNTATVIQADVEASNGVVHVIDAVVMKKAKS